MVSSITAALGSGSGIDTAALVSSLVDNQFALKNQQLKSKSDTITAQISGVSSLKSAITNFSSALTSLVKGGTLATAPTSSNTNVARISTTAGKTVSNLNASLEVVQIAKPQSAASGIIADRTASVGTGSFTLTFGTATVSNGAMTGFTAGGGTPVTINIASGSDSLDGIAASINAANAGVTASVVGDGAGSRLVLKGATGASQGFTLQSSDPGLSDLNIGPNATNTSIGSVAQDAIVKLDGVQVSRASNTIYNLVDNVKLELVGTGTTTLGTTPPTSALTQAVNDFADTYNQVLAVIKEQTDPKTGSLRSDPAALNLQRALAKLPATVISDGLTAGPRTLAEVGIATNRDGTLAVDAGRLATALNNYPAAVEALFRDGVSTSNRSSNGAVVGIGATLAAISATATSSSTGLGASATKYDKAKSDLADLQAKTTDDADKLRTRLTSQFATMDARVAAYKSTQTFLTNQIAAWNKSN